MTQFTDYMALAFEQAEQSLAADEVPVGAVIISSAGRLVGAGQNRMRRLKDASAHAEMLAIKDALQQTGQDRLEGYDIWVTLEPCAMCAGAISHMRFRRLYFAAYDSKSGAVENGPCLFHQPTIHHRPEIIGGLQDSRSEMLLQQFFATRR
jgi:tRNA(adenine34) deaminase